MSKKAKPPEKWEYDGVNQRFARIYTTMLYKDGFKKLKPRTRMLYVYMKERYKGDANKNAPNGDKAQFLFPWHLANKTAELYTNKSTFYSDIQALIDSGFIECVENNKNLRKSNVYKFSDKWKEEGK